MQACGLKLHKSVHTEEREPANTTDRDTEKGPFVDLSYHTHPLLVPEI